MSRQFIDVTDPADQALFADSPKVRYTPVTDFLHLSADLNFDLSVLEIQDPAGVVIAAQNNAFTVNNGQYAVFGTNNGEAFAGYIDSADVLATHFTPVTPPAAPAPVEATPPA